MNKTLLKSVREYKKQSILAPILVILEVLMEVLIPMEMANIIDIGMTSGDLHYIIQRGVILVVMAMLSLFFGISAGNMAAVAGAGYAKNLRHDIFYKVQEFSFKNIDHFATSGLVTRMTTDITNIQMAYMMSIRLLARAPIMIVLSWVMTLKYSVKVALLFLIVIPLLGGTLIFIAKKAHPHFIKVFDEYDILNNSVQENVNASRVVKAFVREDYEINKFHGISKYVYKLFTKAEKIVAWNSPVMQFTMYVVILLLVAIGGTGIIHGTMGTGELTSIIVYALQIIGSLMMVTFVFVMIMIAEASTDRITEVLEEVPEMQDKADAATEVKDGEIIFDHVNFSYGDHPVLKDVCLDAKPGQTIAVMGATGAGKSTLVSLLGRFYDIQSGSIKIDGIDVKEHSLKPLRRKIGYVMQETFLFSDTIADNIRFGNPDASMERVERSAQVAQAKEFIDHMPAGYETVVGERGLGLSGGQKQRVAIARAVLIDPAILVLDDSTSAVDMETEYEIQQQLKEVLKNRTTFVIAHRISSVKNADQILVLDDGAIAERGTHKELMEKGGIYYQMVMDQMSSAVKV